MVMVWFCWHIHRVHWGGDTDIDLVASPKRLDKMRCELDDLLLESNNY
jgi:hypothetical protein